MEFHTYNCVPLLHLKNVLGEGLEMRSDFLTDSDQCCNATFSCTGRRFSYFGFYLCTKIILNVRFLVHQRHMKSY